MDFTEVVRKRRSIRSYEDTIPDREVIDRIVDTARRSPTAGFAQGIDYLVIDDQSAVEWVWQATEHPDHPTPPNLSVNRPPVLVLVFS
ncbi:MAG: nitroreductase family protein, partial [Acidimicrobiia bacterium]